jgi:hypothetical protein
LKFSKGDSHWTKNLNENQRKRMSEAMSGDKNPAKRQDVKDKIRQKAIGRKLSEETINKYKEKTGEKNAFYGKNHIEKSKNVMKEKAKGRWTLHWFINRYGEADGTAKYKERCDILKKPRLEKMIRNEYKCPHCELIGKGPNMKRYHFDNCKNKNNNYELH